MVEKEQAWYHCSKRDTLKEGDVAQLVNCLPGINETLGPVANTTYIEHGNKASFPALGKIRHPQGYGKPKLAWNT